MARNKAYEAAKTLHLWAKTLILGVPGGGGHHLGCAYPFAQFDGMNPTVREKCYTVTPHKCQGHTNVKVGHVM